MTATPPDPNQPFEAGQPSYPAGQPAPDSYGAYGAYGVYGSFPTAPSGAPGTGDAPEQPATIAVAVKLMLVGAALSLLSLVYALITIGGLKGDIRQQLIEGDVEVTQSTIDTAYVIAIVFVILFGLVGALLWVWMAWKNGQGRGWARVVATLFPAIDLLGLLFTGTGVGVGTVSLALTGVSALLGLGVVVLLWRKESTAFYVSSAAMRNRY